VDAVDGQLMKAAPCPFVPEALIILSDSTPREQPSARLLGSLT
jgi:hypothetical protein